MAEMESMHKFEKGRKRNKTRAIFLKGEHAQE
jgi:hypothetical protein